ncbi:MAG TPA: hypothetical protein VGB26_00625 [Nitrospiria bacterium]|jgi:hypothetical protein
MELEVLLFSVFLIFSGGFIFHSIRQKMAYGKVVNQAWQRFAEAKGLVEEKPQLTKVKEINLKMVLEPFKNSTLTSVEPGLRDLIFKGKNQGFPFVLETITVGNRENGYKKFTRMTLEMPNAPSVKSTRRPIGVKSVK